MTQMTRRCSRRTHVFVALLACVAGLAMYGAAAPMVIDRTPSRGEELQIDAPVEIIFDQAMDRASVEAAWSLLPDSPGTFEWAGDTTLRFLPSSAWERDTVFQVTISQSARSATGEALVGDFTFAFRTVGFLELVQMVPAANTADVAVDSPVFLLFNRPVVPLATLSDPLAAGLVRPMTMEPAVAGTGEWVNTSMYVFTPAQPLVGGAAYTVTVPRGLTDTTGGILSQDVVWRFTTERPKVVWTSPRSHAEQVPVNADIQISFNMPVSLPSVQERLALKTTGLLGELFSTAVAGTLTVEGSVAVFTPNQPLEFDKAYVLSLDAGVVGVGGDLGTQGSTSVRFRTVPLPRIVATEPDHQDSEVYPYTSFIIRFNAPIDPDSVLDNLTILPEPKPEELYGYFRTWDNAYVVWFGSRPSQEYEIRIGPNIVDPHGNRTNQPMTVRFKTRALDPTVWLHMPGRTGTFSTYEPAKVFVAHRNTQSLTLSLFKLTLDQYFEAVNDWYRYSIPQSARVRHWDVAVSGALNEITYTPVDLLPDGGSLDPGIYVIDVEAAGASWNLWQNRHVLIASTVNLTMKSADDETLVWACDLSTGEPVPGMILRTYDADGDAVEASVTDREGIATFSGSDDYDWRGVTVASRTPFAMGNSQWTSGMSIWDFGFSSGSSPDQRSFLDTDRLIYRPGQTVSFRGVLRTEKDAVYSLPDVGSVTLTIHDSDWNLIHESEYAVDAFGTFSGQIALAEDAAIGTYRIQVTAGSGYYTTTFDVAAYSPPEFQVIVTPEHDQTMDGQSVLALVQVEYYFGAPVADQSVRWSVYAETYHFSPAGLGRYTFSDRDDPWLCWSCWWLPSTTPVPVLSGSGVTDSSGMLLIELPADWDSDAANDEWRASRSLTIEATVQGEDGRVISGRGTVIVHAAEFYAGLATARSVARAGDPVEVEVITVDWFGERVASRELAYQVVRREWENVFEEDEANGGRWTWTVTDIPVEEGTLWTDQDAIGGFAFTPPEGGTYKVCVTGTDDAGNEARSSLFLWASGPESVSWRRSNDDRITLISDKTEYRVGDTAQILIPSPYSEPHYALLTVERSGILFRQVLLLESNSTILEIPITDDHIPNVYISVVLFRGLEAAALSADGGAITAETKVGYAALTVSSDPKKLHIELRPSDDQPLPSTDIAYDLWVIDSSGNPVRASLAFDLVDAAVLSLQPRTPDAILQTFYGLRGLGVSTSSGLTISINRLVAEQIEEVDSLDQAEYADDGTNVGAGLPPAAMAATTGEGHEEAMRSSAADKLPEGLTVREEFLDTAYWNGAVLTDENGFANLTVRLPDNLTTWVARAVGVTADTKVGESVRELLVTKPLLIRPVTPRFFVVGDRPRLAANVSNQTDVDLIAEVALTQTGLDLEAPAMQVVTIPARGEASVEWWGTVLDVGAVDAVFSVVSGEMSDAARPRLTTGPDGTLLVYKYTSPEVVGTAGQLDEFGSRTELIALLPDADLTRSELLIRLETSLAAAMQQGLRYLEHYPYECTEQVISRFLPNVLTYRALQQLGIKDADLAERLPDLVAVGLEKLYVRQNADGGWGWWAGVESSPHMSAYAVYGLLQAERAGFVIQPRVLSDGLDFLARSLVTPQGLTSFVAANRQAWLAYVLAEGDRHSDALRAIDGLVDHRAKLSHYARAWLALTVQLTHGDTGVIDTLLSDLYADAIISATGVHWEEENYDWWAMNTDTRSTAIILDALVRLDPSQPMLPQVVRWLMVARKDGIWETTQETAWALISLTDWMVATADHAPTYDFYASVNDTEVFAGQTNGTPLQAPIELSIGAGELTPGTVNKLTISRGDGSGRLYYTAHLTTYLPVEEITELQRGIIVQREYVRAASESGDPGSAVNVVATGEEIRVRLTMIAPHDLYYVIVEDPFPAGCEAIDPSLATTSLAAADPGLYRDAEDDWGWFRWWWWQWYSRYEFRDDRVVLFADYLPAGTYTFTYSLRAVVPGEYGVLPTVAQEFYFPEVFGRSNGRMLTITPAED